MIKFRLLPFLSPFPIVIALISFCSLSERMRVVDVNVCMCLAPVMDRYDFSEKFQKLGPGAN